MRVVAVVVFVVVDVVQVVTPTPPPSPPPPTGMMMLSPPSDTKGSVGSRTLSLVKTSNTSLLSQVKLCMHYVGYFGIIKKIVLIKWSLHERQEEQRAAAAPAPSAPPLKLALTADGWIWKSAAALWHGRRLGEPRLLPSSVRASSRESASLSHERRTRCAAADAEPAARAILWWCVRMHLRAVILVSSCLAACRVPIPG